MPTTVTGAFAFAKTSCLLGHDSKGFVALLECLPPLMPKAVPKGGFAVPEWGLAGGFRNAAIAGLDSSLFIVRFHQNGMRLVKPPEKIHSLPAP